MLQGNAGPDRSSLAVEPGTSAETHAVSLSCLLVDVLANESFACVPCTARTDSILDSSQRLLHKAASRGDLAALKRELASGAAVDTPDPAVTPMLKSTSCCLHPVWTYVVAILHPHHALAYATACLLG